MSGHERVRSWFRLTAAWCSRRPRTASLYRWNRGTRGQHGVAGPHTAGARGTQQKYCTQKATFLLGMQEVNRLTG